MALWHLMSKYNPTELRIAEFFAIQSYFNRRS